jgi:hypothetical protein
LMPRPRRRACRRDCRWSACFKPGEPGKTQTRGVRYRRRAPRAPCRRAGTDAGGAIGREALDCRRGGERRQDQAGRGGEALHREPLDAVDVPCRRARTNAGGVLALICPPVWSKIRPGGRDACVTYVGFWRPALWCAALPV